MTNKKIIDRLFYNPIIVFMVIQMLTPRPGTRADFFVELFLITSYALLYLMWTQKGFSSQLLLCRLKKAFEEFKIEIIILLTYFTYEFFLLLIIQPKSIANISFTYRSIYLIIILILGFNINKINDKIINQTLTIIYILLFINFFIAILQYYDVNYFSIIYNDIKSFPKGKLVRLTGLFPNPNEFAWQIAQYMIFILIFESTVTKKVLSLIFSLLFILLSGSRSILVLAPVMFIFPTIFENLFIKKNYKIVVRATIFSLIGFIFMILILIKFKKQLPYASQILQIFDGGLTNVVSFELRIKAWRNVIDKLTKNTVSFLFGMRQISYGSVDNDFIYIWYRSGLFGFIIQQILVLYVMFRLFLSNQKNKLHVYALTLIVFSIVVGLQADTLSGWTFFPYIMLFYGASFRKTSETSASAKYHK